ncbi:MAG: YbaN family protein [Bacteriovorax sp.]|nr:YbaN family protein [Rhizobacter sp.]
MAMQAAAAPGARPLRRVWLAAGCLCLLPGTVGIVVPLLPTVDFYVVAAWCFSRGSQRWENGLLDHPRIGPRVRDWRAGRSVPLKARGLAMLSMTLSCLWAAHALPAAVAWIPALCCLCVAAYLWSRPTCKRPGTAPAAQPG